MTTDREKEFVAMARRRLELQRASDLTELKQHSQLQRALGLAEAIAEASEWKYINRDGLRITAEEIVEILESLLTTPPEEKK